MSRLDLVVGPNGAGKSTFVRFVLAPRRPGVPFVNADVIAAARWPGKELAHGHEAAALAAEARERLLDAREPFIAETVASHPSKVELVAAARARGYHVAVHVVMVDEDLAVQRVAHRVAAGGHDVPEDKIRQRHRRLFEHVAAMAELADSAEFYDNSGEGPQTVALLIGGQVVGAPRWPSWIPAALRGLHG